MGRGAFTHIIQLVECSGEMWATQRAFLVPLTNAVSFKPFLSAETLKACALLGLHLVAAEDEPVSSGGQSLD